MVKDFPYCVCDIHPSEIESKNDQKRQKCEAGFWFCRCFEKNCTYCCIFKPLLSVSRVDINKDRSVSAKEMQRWIMEKTEEHFQEAVRENKLSFRAVDPDQDGRCILFRPVPY